MLGKSDYQTVRPGLLPAYYSRDICKLAFMLAGMQWLIVQDVAGAQQWLVKMSRTCPAIKESAQTRHCTHVFVLSGFIPAAHAPHCTAVVAWPLAN